MNWFTNFLQTIGTAIAKLGIAELVNINDKLDDIMKTQKDLDDAIAALPDKIKVAVEAALAPVIQAIKDKAGATSMDFSPEVASLDQVGQTVADSVTADLTPPTVTPPVEPPVPGPTVMPPP